MNNKGNLFVLEGIDGSGKTVVSKLLSKKLDCEWTCEPFVKFKTTPDHYENLYKFALDRHIHNRDVILPLLEDGKTVICDRNWLSTLCYQGNKFCHDDEWCDMLHLAIPQNMPVVTQWYILHPDVKEAVSRCSKRGESEDIQRLTQIDMNYNVYPGKLSLDNACHISTSGMQVHEVVDRIYNHINSL